MEQPTPMEVDSSSTQAAADRQKALFSQNLSRLFQQLTQGCGRSPCTNRYCASNPAISRRTPNEAASLALQLMTRPDHAQLLCSPITAASAAPAPPSQQLSIAPSQQLSVVPSPSAPISTPAGAQAQGASSPASRSALGTSPVARPALSSSLGDRKPEPPPTGVDLEMIRQLAANATQTSDYTPLIRKVGSIFSNDRSMDISFVKGPATEESAGIDLAEAKEAVKLILALPNVGAQKSLSNALESLARATKFSAPTLSKPEQLRHILFMLEYPGVWEDPANHKTILIPLLSGIAVLARPLQDTLRGWWKRLDKAAFAALVHSIQQFVTLRITTSPMQSLNRDEGVTSATKVLAILTNEEVHALHWSEFYNEAVQDHYEPREDFINWKHSEGGAFSFCNYSFILDAATKSTLLTYESSVMQNQERRNALMRMVETGVMEVPFLGIKIRREHLLEDSLRELSSKDPEDLRKELRVYFVGEEAVDEGGVQKEWFALIVRQIFDPNYGMFTLSSSTHTYWFNSQSNDLDEFKLIGMILGLAIYNGVILDVHFPFIVYKKLMGLRPTLEDLKAFNPGLYAGLTKLLAYEGNVENDIGETFQAPYEVFGETMHHPLKPGGEHLPVTNENRQEYVDLYVKWLLDQSVSTQWNAFIRGFKTVCDSPAFYLLRPEELELCVCGSPNLDFTALEKNTHYESYRKTDQVIVWFWDVVHALPLDQKKKLLFFATGSDRAPPGGLGKLRFIIQRAGGDSDRLPESHTCFNHLVLPEYSSKKKLEDMVKAAINHAEGFGML